MVKGNWLTIRNITQAIYQKQEEPEILYMLGWIEPIAGLFHLQMNILKLFTFTFWGESNDECSLSRFSIALRRKVHKDVKDFHSNNDFFRTIIHSHIIALCMHKLGCPEFDSFQCWVSIQDWPELLKEVENKYLHPLSVHQLHR